MAPRKQQTRSTRTVVEQTEERFAGDEGDTMGNPAMDGTGQYLADHEVAAIRDARQEEGARQDADAERAAERDD